MDKPAKYKDKVWLKSAYNDDGRALSDIADEFDVTIEAVRYYMKKYGIPRRRKGARAGEKNPAWKGGPVTVECEICGDEFEKSRYKYENSVSSYCSYKCKDIGLSERYTGEDNPVFGIRGEDHHSYGRTGEAHPMYGVTGPDNPNWAGGGHWRDGMDWYYARKEALKRDSYECQNCGIEQSKHELEYGEELHVHHITPVSEGGAKYDGDNLTTLCKECHDEIHHKNATAES